MQLIMLYGSREKCTADGWSLDEGVHITPPPVVPIAPETKEEKLHHEQPHLMGEQTELCFRKLLTSAVTTSTFTILHFLIVFSQLNSLVLCQFGNETMSGQR